MEIGAKDRVMEAYQAFLETYAIMNDYKNAFKYHQLYSQIKDSIFNEESSRQTAKMQVRYDSEKKEKEIQLLKKDGEIQQSNFQKQKLFSYSVAVGLLLLIIFSVFISRSLRTTKKQKNIIEEQNVLVENQKKTVENQKELVEKKQKEIIDSITYAKRLQEAILPPLSLIKQHLPESFVLYKPKDIVSGDFYWMEVAEEKVIGNQYSVIGKKPTTDYRPPITIFIAACDCTGHGVPGAMVSVIGHNGLNRCVKEFGITEPAKILDKLTILVEETFDKSENEIKDGMDIALCCFDYKRNVVEFSGAGNSIYYIHHNILQEIKADKQPIGRYSYRKPFTNHVINFQKGDSFYLFTDGFPDQFGGPKQKKFKYAQFKELLLSVHSKPMEEQKSIINESVRQWMDGTDQTDDICVLGVRI